MKLSEIQRRFSRAIKDPEHASGFLSLVRDAPHVSFLGRLEVYQSAYKIRMVESLRDDFGRVEEKIGEAEFRELAEKYLGETPSRYASLAEFSQGFPEFIQRRSPAHYRVASIDWIEILASHAPAFPRENILSAEEIQSGSMYRIVQNPTLQIHIDSEATIVAFRSRLVVFTRELSFSELQVLSLFSKGQTSVGIGKALKENKIDENAVLPLISEWIGAEILYCGRI